MMFVLGLLVKYTDFLSDSKRVRKRGWRYLSASAYGAIIGFLLGANAMVSGLVAGNVIGNLFSRKFDEKAHYFALAVALIFGIWSVAAFGLKQFSFAIFPIILAFAIAAFCDELLAERLKKKNRKIFGVALRPIVPIAALLISAFTGEWIYFFAMLSFDIAYAAAARALKD